ncbi:MAG: NAD(P)/FAD-dependent oxidoreductase [Pseudomonadota bacterium]
MTSPKKDRVRIGIVGAGFGGITAALALSQSPDVYIDIIDRKNHHLFQPLLYQVAMAGLNPSDIAIPIRSFFSRSKNVSVLLAEIDDVNLQDIGVHFDERWHYYDYLILATGAKHSYFGNDEWEHVAPGLKTLEQAIEIRRRVLTAFELAEKTDDKALQNAHLTFAIVGGGPTGVEIAGAISELARTTLKKEYRNANLSQTSVHLIEAGPRILEAFPEELSIRAERDLKDLGVHVLKNTKASKLSSNGLMAGNTWINCKTIIWAAGVKPSSLAEKGKSTKGPGGRLVVGRDLSLPNAKNVFAIGDMAFFESHNGKALPGIAPVATQQGQFLARLIRSEMAGKKRPEFVYWDKGIMATIGRSRAVVSAPKFRLTGTIAWFIWVLIHVVYLMKFKNRVFVFFQWMWAYFELGHGARLITQRTWRFYSDSKISYDNEDQ